MNLFVVSQCSELKDEQRKSVLFLFWLAERWNGTSCLPSMLNPGQIW